jgi:hypothetical protein
MPPEAVPCFLHSKPVSLKLGELDAMGRWRRELNLGLDYNGSFLN